MFSFEIDESLFVLFDYIFAMYFIDIMGIFWFVGCDGHPEIVEFPSTSLFTNFSYKSTNIFFLTV